MIENDDKRIKEYYDLKPGRFSVLKLFSVRQEFGPSGVMEQIVSIVLSQDFNDDGECLYVDCFGVRNLEFKQPELGLVSISLLEIYVGREVPSVEGAYFVVDPEQERVVSLECREFSAAVR